jgi:hypothetical protein
MRNSEIKYRGEGRWNVLYAVEKRNWRRTKGEGMGDCRELATRWEYDMMLLLATWIIPGINCIRERLINGRCSLPHTQQKDGRMAPYSRKTPMQQYRAIKGIWVK